MTSYEYKYLSDERELMKLLQNGPVATWLDVGRDLMFFKSGVYYNAGICGNNEVVFSCEGAALEVLMYVCLSVVKLKF